MLLDSFVVNESQSPSVESKGNFICASSIKQFHFFFICVLHKWVNKFFYSPYGMLKAMRKKHSKIISKTKIMYASYVIFPIYFFYLLAFHSIVLRMGNSAIFSDHKTIIFIFICIQHWKLRFQFSCAIFVCLCVLSSFNFFCFSFFFVLPFILNFQVAASWCSVWKKKNIHTKLKKNEIQTFLFASSTLCRAALNNSYSKSVVSVSSETLLFVTLFFF